MSRKNLTQRTDLKGQDLAIFNLHMRGAKNKEIASILGITEQTVSACLQMDVMKEAKEEVLEESIKYLSSGVAAESAMTIARANAPRLMAMQVQLAMTARSDAIKLRAINDVLDRGMGKPTQRIINDNMDDILDAMSETELEQYMKTKEIPERLKNAPGSGTVH